MLCLLLYQWTCHEPHLTHRSLGNLFLSWTNMHLNFLLLKVEDKQTLHVKALRINIWSVGDQLNSVKTTQLCCGCTKARPGTDCVSDHQLLNEKFKLKPKKICWTAWLGSALQWTGRLCHSKISMAPLSWTSYSPRLWENTFVLFKLPSLQYFIVAAWAD